MKNFPLVDQIARTPIGVLQVVEGWYIEAIGNKKAVIAPCYTDNGRDYLYEVVNRVTAGLEKQGCRVVVVAPESYEYPAAAEYEETAWEVLENWAALVWSRQQRRHITAINGQHITALWRRDHCGVPVQDAIVHRMAIGRAAALCRALVIEVESPVMAGYYQSLLLEIEGRIPVLAFK